MASRESPRVNQCYQDMATLLPGMDHIRLDQDGQSVDSEEAGYACYAETEPGDVLPFYEIEGKILALWDELNELKLELAIAEAPSVDVEGTDLTEEEVAKELEKAEKELLEARAKYMLKESAVEDTVIISPILNAIHAGGNATGSERTLKPLLDRRDVLEVASTNIATSLETTIDKTVRMGAERLGVMDQNRISAATLLALADEIKEEKEAAARLPEASAQLESARQEAEIAKSQWMLMKGVVSAVIAGSGVDWARDNTLRDLVLDHDHDDT